jgi:hypothetical protein
MRPDSSAVTSFGVQKIDKAVGFYISDANLALESKSAGGSGYQVRYLPYRDIEPGFYKALTEVFTKVVKVEDPRDALTLTNDGLTLVLVPTIQTTSFSPSILTWPPTQFTVTLDCRITNVDGSSLTNIHVIGTGSAEFSEFKDNFSLSAARASEDALKKLMVALRENAALR